MKFEMKGNATKILQAQVKAQKTASFWHSATAIMEINGGTI